MISSSLILLTSQNDVISQALEEKFPEPPLATPPEKASVMKNCIPTPLLSEVPKKVEEKAVAKDDEKKEKF